MSKKTWTIRPLIPPVSAADRKAVLELNTRAFKGKDEAQIVEKLEKDAEIWLEVVAESEGKIIGHILFFPIGVLGKLGAMGLGPMSVDPKFQKQGVGTHLINFGLNEAKQAGVPIVFVLGHEEYYPKFGFSVDAAKDFESEYKGPHFMAVRYRFGPPMSGKLIYPEAFSGAPRAR
jgi:putative acetyltransferase